MFPIFSRITGHVNSRTPIDPVRFVAFGLRDLEKVLKDSRVACKDRSMDTKLSALDLENYASIVERSTRTRTFLSGARPVLGHCRSLRALVLQ